MVANQAIRLSTGLANAIPSSIKRIPTHPGHKLDIVRHPVPAVQRPILRGLIADPQQVHHLALVNTHLGSHLRQPLVRLVPGLVHDLDVKVLVLLLEEGGAEFPELVRGECEDCGAGLVGEG